MVFGCQISKGLRIDIPGAFKRVVEVSQHEVCEEEKHGCNRDGDESKRQVVKGKKEKQKENGRGCDRNEEKKSARNAFGAEGEAFVTVSAGLIRDLEQMLVGPAFRIILGMDLDDAGDDRGKQFLSVRSVSAPCDSMSHLDSVTARAYARTARTIGSREISLRPRLKRIRSLRAQDSFRISFSTVANYPQITYVAKAYTTL